MNFLKFLKKNIHNNPISISNRSKLKLLKVPIKCSLQQLSKITQINIDKLQRFPILNKKLLSNIQIQICCLLNNIRPIFSQKLPVLKDRPPVVTIMGHVDHGKTSILDFFRNSNVAKNESGGITQKISAFNVQFNDKFITFIDTPGHQTFKGMRSRGASATDIVILVISSTEGYKQQTLQVLNIVKQFNIPLIVAITKIDLQGSNPLQVQKQLFQLGYGVQQHGNIPCIHVSSKNGKNMNLLLDLILQQAKNLNLKSQYQCLADGLVIESRKNIIDTKLVSAILLRGSLKQGDYILAGNIYGKIRKIYGNNGKIINKATPSTAVQIQGLKQMVNVGQILIQIDNESKAKKLVQILSRQKAKQTKIQKAVQVPKIKIKSKTQRKLFYKGIKQMWQKKFKQAQNGIIQKIQQLKKLNNNADQQKLKQLQKKLQDHRKFVKLVLLKDQTHKNTIKLIVKTKDGGMLQAIQQQLNKAIERGKNLDIIVEIVKKQIGQINQSDLQQAFVFKGIILGMDVNPSTEIMQIAVQNNITIINHNIIYNIYDSLNRQIIIKKYGGMIPTKKGQAVISQIFFVSKGKSKVKAAGIKITDGRFTKRFVFQIVRNNVQIATNIHIQVMKHFKKQVNQLKKGDQCTIIFQNYYQFQKGDSVRCIQLVKITQNNL